MIIMISEGYINFNLWKDYQTLGFGKVSEDDFTARFYPIGSNFSSCLRGFAKDGLLYNFIVDHKFQLQSRVREFKGPFKNRAIKLEENYSDKEIFFSDNLSAYVGIRKLSSSYFEDDKQYHYDFSHSFLLVSEEPIIDLLEICNDFLKMERSGIRIRYEKLLPFLGERTLIKYWGLENNQFGYVVVGKGQKSCRAR